MKRKAPGSVRDAVFRHLREHGPSPLTSIVAGVEAELGNVSQSSVRSCLNLNTPGTFTRIGRGYYGLAETK